MQLTEDNLRRRLEALEPKTLPAGAATPYASVAAVLRYRATEPEVLLIKRSERPADPWSGHMAFPGGRQSPADRDLVHTAVRETFEEVGLDLARGAELLGRLDDVQAISRARPTDLIIVPHVFLAREASETPLHPASAEVDEALWAPLGPMLRGETLTTRPYELHGRRLDLPAFEVGEHLVWGLTYRMLELLFDALGP